MPSAPQNVAPSTPVASRPGQRAAASCGDSQSTSIPWARCSATLARKADTLALGRQQKQIAVRPVVDRGADHLFEMREERDRLFRQLDVGGVRELMAEAAGIAACRPGAELRLAFDERDVGEAALAR